MALTLVQQTHVWLSWVKTPKFIENAEGARTTPSVISFPADGELAKRQ